MKTLIAASSLVLALMMPSIGSASELKPLQAGTFKLGSQHISIYYKDRGETYEVVTTIAPDYDTSGTPVRFVSHLQPGQVETVSVGAFGASAANTSLELVHQGDKLSVVKKTQTAKLN